jgi:Protein of unknown function (DUF3311)
VLAWVVAWVVLSSVIMAVVYRLDPANRASAPSRGAAGEVRS